MVFWQVFERVKRGYLNSDSSGQPSTLLAYAGLVFSQAIDLVSQIQYYGLSAGVRASEARLPEL